MGSAFIPKREEHKRLIMPTSSEHRTACTSEEVGPVPHICPQTMNTIGCAVPLINGQQVKNIFGRVTKIGCPHSHRKSMKLPQHQEVPWIVEVAEADCCVMQGLEEPAVGVAQRA